MRKSKRPTYEEVVFDASFKIVGVEVLQQEEKYAWCSFCGGRLRHPVLLERNDGQAFRVGKTCIGRVGLELTGSEKTVWRRKHRKVAEPKPRVEEPKPMKNDDVAKLVAKWEREKKEEEDEKFPKEIEELVKAEKKPKDEEGEDYFSLDDVFED